MANHYAVVWNPAPIVTHILQDDMDRTLCGVKVVRGWESGEDYEQSELDASFVGCLRCRAAADRLTLAAQEPQP